jgi:hypothetical protein
MANGAMTRSTTGGPDGDVFVFDAAPDKRYPDAITDFSVVDDRIWLDDAVFTALGLRGPLAARMFYVGSAARDLDDRIIYDLASGVSFVRRGWQRARRISADRDAQSGPCADCCGFLDRVICARMAQARSRCPRVELSTTS